MRNFMNCKCPMQGECFAKRDNKCTILTDTNFDKCSFQKPKRTITNGQDYSINYKRNYSSPYLEKNVKQETKKRIKTWDAHIEER